MTEVFLFGCLGGRYEPISDDFKGSSITVPVGKEQIPGLEEALGKNEYLQKFRQAGRSPVRASGFVSRAARKAE